MKTERKMLGLQKKQTSSGRTQNLYFLVKLSVKLSLYYVKFKLYIIFGEIKCKIIVGLCGIQTLYFLIKCKFIVKLYLQS